MKCPDCNIAFVEYPGSRGHSVWCPECNFVFNVEHLPDMRKVVGDKYVSSPVTEQRKLKMVYKAKPAQPSTIEAIQWHGNNLEEIRKFPMINIKLTVESIYILTNFCLNPDIFFCRKQYRPIEIGDYLLYVPKIKIDDGYTEHLFSICSEYQFENRFEPVAEGHP